jgi:hypothetical protein
MIAGNQALDRIHPLVEPAGKLVQLFEQRFVVIGKGRGGLPLGDVMKDDPRQTNEDRQNRG